MIHPTLKVLATFRSTEVIGAITSLKGTANVRDISRSDLDGKTDIVVWLNEAGVDRALDALRSTNMRFSRCFISIETQPEFWASPPDDCLGALLAPDGYLAVKNDELYWKILPINEPLYSIGRPDADSEHAKYKPHLIHAGGIPIVSDGLLMTLRQLGAQGETGTVVYRGSNKKAYDTVQPGFQRFLIKPEYDMPSVRDVEFLPEKVPEGFGICSMLRRWNRPGKPPHIPRDKSQDRWYEIAVAREPCRELHRLRKNVLLNPIFDRAGPTFQWVNQLEMLVEELSR